MSVLPMVSVCTPTFNRRPFFPYIIQCFLNQDYPKHLIEWVIIDDGTDKIGDLVIDIPRVKYFYYKDKMTLGKKRNIAHTKCSGEIIVYMDDDDYYPSSRISHAVDSLNKNPHVLCAGSSEMCIYFKHIHKMYQFGPYGPNHSTAATFAFRRKLLEQTCFDNNASLAEEKYFLKNYTIPFIQLDPLKTILVFSHIHNSFDKKKLLINPDTFVKLSNRTVDDFIKEPEIKTFFLEKIDNLLNNYDFGKPELKPDVLKQIDEIMNDRDNRIEKHKISILEKTEKEHKKLIGEQSTLIQELMMENNALKDKVKYYEEKIRKIVKDRILEASSK
jgi:glycosyltransferase involved in cell wall biosynthesis